MLLALTFGAHFYPISALLPWLVCTSVMMSSYMVLRHQHHVQWSLLARQVLPGMGLGMLASYTIFADAPEAALRWFLALFVTAAGLVELRRFFNHASTPAPAPLSRPAFGFAAVAAGIVHGVTATGGPLLVYGLGRLGLHKSEFRSTLATVWLILNGSLALGFYSRGELTGDDAVVVASLAPLVILSIIMGEFLHGRINERGFKLVVVVMLILAGLSLLA